MAVKQGQNTVNPIRDPEQIQIIKEYLLHQSYQDYFLFTFGINSGLRINDILKLRVIDVRNTDYLRVKEKKTNQTRKFRMTSVLKQEIEKYTRQMADSDLLFPSRKGTGPIGRETAWRIINNTAQMCGIEGGSDRHAFHAQNVWLPLLPANKRCGHPSANLWPFSPIGHTSLHRGCF